MPQLDQKQVQDAIDKAYDAEVANLFKTLIENMLEVASGVRGGGFTRADQCVGAFARSMKCEVAKQMATYSACAAVLRIWAADAHARTLLS